MIEEWRAISGFDNIYEVSNTGLVRSLRRGIVLKSSFNRGYRQVVLQFNRWKITRKIHILVADAFIPNPENLPVINHLDGNKSNNHVNNLRRCTQSENSIHAVETGLQGRGEKLSYSKLKDADIPVIRELFTSGKTVDDIGYKFGVNRKTIIDVINKRTWKHL